MAFAGDLTVMPSRRWLRAKQILDAAELIPASEMTQFVTKECGDDIELRHEVETLLALDGHAVIPKHFEPHPEDIPEVPQLIEDFRLVGLLGKGGTGSVYRAVRETDGYTAAIKLSQLSSTNQQVRRQGILETLRHPNIPRLISKGKVSGVWKYVIREFVDGIPAHQWIAARTDGGRGALDRFLKVCSIAAYLHANGIVHGDLKPANILVSADNEPHLIDFGNAVRPGSKDTRMKHDIARFTPAFASPEQMSGGRITPASDVYSLGVWLAQITTNTGYAENPGLAATLQKAKSTDPSSRHATAQDLYDEVLAVS